jgi:uncharacterized phage protein (TIGR02220 family)
MKLYRIRDWQELYENNRSRTVKDLSWVAIPNRHDGENYTMIMSHKRGSEIFSAFILMVEVASKCRPRGTLIRDNGKPHNPISLSLKCRCPASWFEIAIEYLSENTDWLEFEDIASGCQEPVSALSASCQAGDEEGKGMERKELNGKNGTYPPESRVALYFLNEQSGRNFRETAENLGFITARLKEDGVDIEGVKKMIVRQCSIWKGTAQAEYLRPQTLFNATKFDAYYAAKDVPVQTSLPIQKTESKQIQETINVPTL